MLLNCGVDKNLESPLDHKEIKPVISKGNQSWMFIGRTDAEAEGPILWPPDAKNWLLGKDPDAGKDRRQEEKGTTEDEMLVWHHWLNGHKFEQTPGDNEGQGSVVGCSPWGHKESDTTEWLNHLTVTLPEWNTGQGWFRLENFWAEGDTSVSELVRKTGLGSLKGAGAGGPKSRGILPYALGSHGVGPCKEVTRAKKEWVGHPGDTLLSSVGDTCWKVSCGKSGLFSSLGIHGGLVPGTSQIPKSTDAQF